MIRWPRLRGIGVAIVSDIKRLLAMLPGGVDRSAGDARRAAQVHSIPDLLLIQAIARGSEASTVRFSGIALGSTRQTQGLSESGFQPQVALSRRRSNTELPSAAAKITPEGCVAILVTRSAGQWATYSRDRAPRIDSSAFKG